MKPTFTNSVLVTVGDNCVIFDAWGKPQDWQARIANKNLIAIYSTHGHYDHILAAPHLGAPWYLNHNDLFLVPNDCTPPLDLPAGEFEILPGLWTRVILTPGHSAGGVAFWFEREKIMLIGDTIFQDTIGRYDLPGADYNALMESVKKIYDLNLPDDTTVIHGHGENTTIAELKKNNKYFR